MATSNWSCRSAHDSIGANANLFPYGSTNRAHFDFPPVTFVVHLDDYVVVDVIVCRKLNIDHRFPGGYYRSVLALQICLVLDGLNSQGGKVPEPPTDLLLADCAHLDGVPVNRDFRNRQLC